MSDGKLKKFFFVLKYGGDETLLCSPKMGTDPTSTKFFFLISYFLNINTRRWPYPVRYVDSKHITLKFFGLLVANFVSIVKLWYVV